MIKKKTKEEIGILAEGGRILATIVDQAIKLVKSGVSTDFLDDEIGKMLKQHGAKSAFLNYRPIGAKRPFPANSCISINDEIVHGIPNENPKIIKDGDVVTIDLGIEYRGLITDHAVSVAVGEVSKEIRELLNRTREALNAGIKSARAGNTIGDIGHAIESVAKKHGFCVIDDLCGHGVGYKVHEDPYVPNYGESGKGDRLEPGMVIAIEPMFGLGSPKIKLDRDGYTLKTTDGSIACQFEHTIAITEKGTLVLTKC